MESTEEIVGKKEIDVNSDFLDELNFRPVNKGLGFHQERKAQNNSYSQKIKRPLATPIASLEKRSDSFTRSHIDQTITLSNAESQLVYKNNIKVIPEPQIPEVSGDSSNDKKKLEIEEASYAARGVAYLLDLSILVVCYFLFSILIMMNLELNFNRIVDGLGPSDFIISNVVLFSLMYLFYFSVLDINKTLGKNLLGIHLQKSSHDRVDLKASFLRALTTLLSLPLLGLPSMLDFQNKISETIVVKDLKIK